MRAVPLLRYDTEERYISDFSEKLAREDSPRALCDFCTRSEGSWTYPCGSFVMTVARVPGRGDVEHRSQGSWAACDECAGFVDAGDIDGLIARYLELTGVDPEVVEYLRPLWGDFFRLRKGPRLDADLLQRRCPHPREAIEANGDTLGSLNPHHHTGVVCSLCGTNLQPQLYAVRDGWHRKVGLRSE